MPITPQQEFFNGGLVNVRDASLLQPGELQKCDHCVYRPFDPAIHGAPGRQAVHSTRVGTTGAIKGLAWLSADAAKDQLLAYNGTDLYLADFTAITGLVWVKVQGVGTLHNDGQETLNAVKYDTAYYLHNGIDLSRRIGFITPQPRIVTTCTIASGVTVTSTEANIFSAVVVGQKVTGTGVPSGTYVSVKNYTVTAGVYNVTSLTLSQTCTNGSALTLTFTADVFVSSRIMGMASVATMQYTITVNSSASYAWPDSGDFGGNGFYWVFYTEAYMPGEIDDYPSGYVESAFTAKDSDLQMFEISAHATQGITVKRNDELVNDGGTDKGSATHWIIYMSPKSKDPLAIPDRGEFVRIGGPIPISSVSQNISTTATDSGWKYATAYTNPAPGYDEVTNPTGPFAPGGLIAYFNDDDEGYFLRTWGFATSALTVTGIEIEIGMYYNGFERGDGNGMATYLQRVDSGGTVTKQSTTVPNAVIHGNPGGLKTFHFGGNFDTFNPSPSAWLGSDFFDSTSTFRVFVRSYWWDVALDYLRIKVHYDGFSPKYLGANYRTVTYRSQVGTTVVDSAALPPPVGASTGAVYRGQNVMNSRVARNGIFYSQTGFPEYFPKPYFMTFDSPKKDIVTNIKRVGSVLIVGLRDNIQRVNYLPTELDTDGQGGLAFEPVATDHGITGPLAACVVDIPNLGTVLVYTSFKGIHYTDGIRPRFLNTDLNWLKTVKASTLANVELLVYPAMNWVVMFYCPYGAPHTRNTRALVFDYSPDKIKQGPGGMILPAVGPFTVSGRAACSATIDGVDYFLTAHEDNGFVYAEDQGNSPPSGYYTQEVADSSVHATTKIVPHIRTRLFYAAGVERDARVERTYFRYDNNGTAYSVASCICVGTTVTKTNGLGSIVPGMSVSGVGVRPGTIVISVTSDDSAELSHAMDTDGTVTLVFDTGTLMVRVRGQGMRDSMADIESGYISTYEGNLNDIHLDNMRQALELEIIKTELPSGTTVDLGTPMRLHYFTDLIGEVGIETGRAS